LSGIAIITEACIDVKDRACVDVCPVQCIYELDVSKGVLFSEDEAGSGTVENTHMPNQDAVAIFGDSLLYVNADECTSCTACYQDDVCPVGAIYSEEDVPDGSPNTSLHGISTLVPALHRGWTDDIYAASLRAGRSIQRALVGATSAADRGIVRRSDLTGFNWANVPAVLVETGFLSNPAERRRLHTSAYRLRVAAGLTAGISSYLR